MREKIIAQLIVFIIFTAAVSAAGRNESGSIEDNGKERTAKDETKVELRLDYSRFNKDFLEHAVQYYNNTNEMIKIIPKRYDNLDGQTQSKRLAEILSGDGPDILAEIYLDRLLNNYKAVTSGIYFDMNDMFNNNKDINSMDFYQPVIDDGIIDGERLFITYLFEVPGVFTSLDVLKKHDINLDRFWDWRKIEELVDGWLQKEKKEDIFLFNEYFFRILKGLFSNLYVGINNKETYFDKNASIEYLTLLKRMQPLIRPFEMDERHSSWLYVTEERSVFSGVPGVMSCGSLQMMRKLIKKGGKELDIFPIPVPGEEKKFVFRPVETIGICNSCKNKKAAFEFITFLISDKMMANPEYNHLIKMPVNKAAANKLMAHFQKEPIGGLALPDRIMNKIFYTLDNLQKLALGDGQVALIVHKYYQQYLNDEITVEEAVKKMKMSADLYLGE